jgi:hypothetical protein
MGQLRAIAGLSALVLFLGTAPTAVAQSVPENGTEPVITVPPVSAVSATDVPEIPTRKSKKPKADPYSVYGYDDGAMRLRPTLEVGAVVSSNPALASAGSSVDVGLRLKPSFSFESNWPRHAWRGSLSAEVVKFAATPSANTVTGTADTAFRLDIRHTTHADISAGFSSVETNAGSSEVPGTAIGPRHDTSFNSSIGLTHDFGLLEGEVKTAILHNTYGDVALSGGGTELNADRNYWEPSLTLRGALGHEGNPLRPYVEARYDPRVHDQQIDRNGQQRNSQGGGLALGVMFDDGPMWKGDIGGNFIARSYDDPALKAAFALGLNGSVTWSPTPLWNIVASTGVGLNESEVAGVSATQSWNAGLQANYAWRDNVNFRSGANVTLAASGAALDTTTVASLGADWQLNPNMSLSGTVQNTWFAPGSGAGGYSEQRVMSSVVLKP